MFKDVKINLYTRRSLVRRRYHAPLTQTCKGGVTASCKSRRAQRPRKLDVTLSRHGRSARRVAFLRPRGVFSDFCSPLDYVSARTKHFQEDEKLVPHDRRTAPIPSGGGKPEWGSPQNVHFVGSPVGGGNNIPCGT